MEELDICAILNDSDCDYIPENSDDNVSSEDEWGPKDDEELGDEILELGLGLDGEYNVIEENEEVGLVMQCDRPMPTSRPKTNRPTVLGSNEQVTTEDEYGPKEPTVSRPKPIEVAIGADEQVTTEDENGVEDDAEETNDAIVEDEGVAEVDEEVPRGRKRSRNPEKWKRAVNKKSRHLGLAFVSRSGKVVDEKKFVDVLCGCKSKCNDKITAAERENNFNSFYALGDMAQQNLFIRGIVQSSQVQKRRPRNETKTPRSMSLKYFLKKGADTIKVCKKYFRDTYKISDTRILRCCSGNEETVLADKRGQKEPTNKLDVSGIVSHIKSYPAYTSHYSRTHNPNRKYLNEKLTIKAMFMQYVAECTEQGITPLQEKMYYHVFSTQFNLHFKSPLKDTCQLCDSLKIKINYPETPEAKAQASQELDSHLALAEAARLSLRNDKALASEDTYVFTFDLQKALPFPKLTTSTAYYKRNMYVYKLGCHSINDNVGFMYMWDETQGSRGSQEIASCIKKHLLENATTHKKIIMYTDCCTGQNRNIKMALSLLKLVQDTRLAATSIDHKFLVSGHSFLPNDADFGVIESSAKKHQCIYGPQDWYDIARGAKKKDPQFKVIEMQREEFLSTKVLEESITKRKKTIDGGAVNWLQMKWMHYDHDVPNSYKFKNCHNAETNFYEVSLAKSGRGRPSDLGLITQDVMYANARPVTREKKRDMMDLIKYIPPVHHDFFRKLPTVSVLAEDSDYEDNVYD